MSLSAVRVSSGYLYSARDLWKEIEEHGPRIIHPRTEKEWDDMRNEYDRRHKFNKQYSFAVPTLEAINEIKEFIGSGKILEIGSGHGLWAKLLQDAGVHVTPTDSKIHKKDWYEDDQESFTHIQDRCHSEAIETFGSSHDTLMLSWPPYDNPMAAEALRGFNGDKIVYIGEGYGGCTGDDVFHQELESNWEEVKNIDIPQWHGIHDSIYLYKRKRGV